MRKERTNLHLSHIACECAKRQLPLHTRRSRGRARANRHTAHGVDSQQQRTAQRVGRRRCGQHAVRHRCVAAARQREQRAWLRRADSCSRGRQRAAAGAERHRFVRRELHVGDFTGCDSTVMDHDNIQQKHSKRGSEQL